MTFSVLFVCTGNLCRSPIAERLFRARIADDAPAVSASAGTAGLAGHAMDGPSAIALRELGGDPEGHAARRLTSSMVRNADLILAAETRHRFVILQADPLAFPRAFTLREFARLGATLSPSAQPATSDTLVARVREVAQLRGQASPAQPGADDIADPFGAALPVARRCARQVAEAVDAGIEILGLNRFDPVRSVPGTGGALRSRGIRLRHGRIRP